MWTLVYYLMEVAYMLPGQAGSDGKSKLHEDVFQMSIVYTPIIMPLSVKYTPIVSWGVPYDWLTVDENPSNWFIDCLHIMQLPPRNGH